MEFLRLVRKLAPATSAVLGAVLVLVGVWLLLGVAAAMLVAGVGLLAYGLLSEAS